MFFKKCRGALWVCIWYQGGRWTEKVWEPLVYSVGHVTYWPGRLTAKCGQISQLFYDDISTTEVK